MPVLNLASKACVNASSYAKRQSDSILDSADLINMSNVGLLEEKLSHYSRVAVETCQVEWGESILPAGAVSEDRCIHQRPMPARWLKS